VSEMVGFFTGFGTHSITAVAIVTSLAVLELHVPWPKEQDRHFISNLLHTISVARYVFFPLVLKLTLTIC
jgi:hypothetical protein